MKKKRIGNKSISTQNGNVTGVIIGEREMSKGETCRIVREQMGTRPNL